MSVKITKFWSNRLLLLVLVTAFLAVQWAPAHIHLSELHNHDGSNHQHQIETHAHNLTNQTFADDASYQTSHANVIELAQECRLPKQEKQKFLSTSLVSVKLLQSRFLVSIKIPATTNSKVSYFDISTVNPRAPPQIS